MALSVGVVSIEYLEEPKPPVSDFLKDLALNPNLGMQDWGGGWEGNSFLEFQRRVMSARARKWCTQNGVDEAGRTAIRTWIAALPWQDGYVMLHLG